MKNKAALIAGSVVYFDSYPDVEVFYATSDGQYFLEASPAHTHQRSLNVEGCTEAVKVTRGDLEKQAETKKTKAKKAAQVKKMPPAEEQESKA